jgi:hypothetical protein
MDNKNDNDKRVELRTESFGDSHDPACLLICGADAPAKF